jgi:hypothetical protein
VVIPFDERDSSIGINVTVAPASGFPSNLTVSYKRQFIVAFAVFLELTIKNFSWIINPSNKDSSIDEFIDESKFNKKIYKRKPKNEKRKFLCQNRGGGAI